MGDWTELTVATVTNALPTDMATLYATWIDVNPGKVTRLGELVAETVSIYRAAVASNPSNELDVALNTVPTTGFRHALNQIMFNLGMEMGVQFAPEVYSLITRADIWLRMVESGTLTPVGVVQGTPSYRKPRNWRVLRWVKIDRSCS